LQWNMFVYFIDIWSIILPFDIFYGHLVYCVVIRYIFPVLVYWIKQNLATLLLYLDIECHTWIKYLLRG
jgi:hypothetical protein